MSTSATHSKLAMIPANVECYQKIPIPKRRAVSSLLVEMKENDIHLLICALERALRTRMVLDEPEYIQELVWWKDQLKELQREFFKEDQRIERLA